MSSNVFIQKLPGNFILNGLWRRSYRLTTNHFKPQSVNTETVNIEVDSDDLPVTLEKNPYEREKPKCILCKYNVEPDYKNVRLLSQFQSRFTGKIYERHITGLCKPKQEKLEQEIRKAQSIGLMGIYTKDPRYVNDPKLFNPNNPFKPHNYG